MPEHLWRDGTDNHPGHGNSPPRTRQMRACRLALLRYFGSMKGLRRNALAALAVAGITVATAWLIWYINSSKSPVNASTVVAGDFAPVAVAVTLLTGVGAWWRKGSQGGAARGSAPSRQDRPLEIAGPAPADRVRQVVQGLLRAGRPDEADHELGLAMGVLSEAERMYWRARVALARDNIPAAAAYADKALELERRDETYIALKIRILLLSTDPDDRLKAAALSATSRGISSSLDSWLTCVESAGLLGPGIRTGTEIDANCPYPDSGGAQAAHQWGLDSKQEEKQ